MSTEEVPEVLTMNFKLPEFWPNDPLIWFAQIEAIFSTRKVTSDRTKFNILLSSLSPDLATEVREVLLNPPATDAYVVLKEAILKRTSLSVQKRIQQLLRNEELGDRTPSQLLRRMQQLLGDKASTIDKSILKEIFVQRLSSNVRIILATLNEEMSLESQAEIADKIMEISPNLYFSNTEEMNINNTNKACSCQKDISRLSKEILELGEKINTIKTQFNTSRRFARNRSPSISSKYCYYHKRFGSQAHRCISPCEWSSENSSASN